MQESRAEFPPVAGANIAGMVYGRRVGGDFYHFLRATPQRVVFGLLDVAGSCEANRDIVAAARRSFQDAGKRVFADTEINEADAMMELCMELNAALRRAAHGICTCAAFLGCYDEALGTVCYANAGHTPGLLCDATGVTELPATGLPLGLFSASTYEAPYAALQPGASLLLVSRGVVEAAHKKEEFGLHRVKQHLQRVTPSNADQVTAVVLKGVQQFIRTAAHNDLTALALVRSAGRQKLAAEA